MNEDKPTIHFTNTLGGKKEPFEPLHPPEVTFYSCGPTVYNFAHIGNLRAFVSYDLVRRFLDWRGYDVRHVMNITDVDDKMIRVANEEKISLTAVRERFEAAFLEDLRALNVLAGWGRSSASERAEAGIEAETELPRATEHIDDMLGLVARLTEREIAYRSDDGSVYFGIGRLPGYGRLSGVDQRELKSGARVSHDEYEKEEARDFALWKAWTPGDGDVAWESDYGRGRPGWHLECSAMSMRYLGEELDIHAGGVDLVFPHHENEIAQSEGATGKPFVRTWLHNAHLTVDGQKMAKRLGNVYRLRDLTEERDHDPLAVRYALMAAHYRQPLNFTFDGLKAAAGALARLRNAVVALADRLGSEDHHRRVEAVEEMSADAARRFDVALSDDLNVPEALAAVFDFVGELNKMPDLGAASAKVALDWLRDVDRVLGIGLADAIDRTTHRDADPEAVRIEGLLKEREDARRRKDWARADEIRDELAADGITIEDKPDGTRWHRQP